MRPVTFDVECYINFFEVGFLDVISGKYKIFQMFGDEYISTNELRSFLTKKSRSRSRRQLFNIGY